MTSYYYSASSAEYLGTTREPECSTAVVRRLVEAYAARGGVVRLKTSEPERCRGTVVWVWLHSEHPRLTGDGDSSGCSLPLMKQVLRLWSAFDLRGSDGRSSDRLARLA